MIKEFFRRFSGPESNTATLTDYVPVVRKVDPELLGENYRTKWSKAQEIIKLLSPISPEIEIVGSLRRAEPLANDIDILVKKQTASTVHKALYLLEMFSEDCEGIIFDGLTIRGHISGIKYDVIFAEEQHWGMRLLNFTGSRLFNEVWKKQAEKKGLTVNDKELICKKEPNRPYKDREIPCMVGASEKEILRQLGLIEYLDPTTRL